MKPALLLPSVASRIKIFEPRKEFPTEVFTPTPRTRSEFLSNLILDESEYCSSLAWLRDEYVKPLKDDSKLPKPFLFARSEFQKIVVFLTNVETLLTLNTRFKDELKARRGGVGQVLEQYASLFQMYGQYVGDYTGAVEAVNAQAESNEKFAMFLKAKEAGEGGKTMLGLMKLPLERLRTYQEYTANLIDASQNEKDLEALMAAETALGRTADHVADQFDTAVRVERFRQLQKEWTGINLVTGLGVNPDRLLIHEGDLDECSKRQRERFRFVLFNDVLIYGVPSAGNDKVRFKFSLPLASMVVKTGMVTSGEFNALTLDDSRMSVHMDARTATPSVDSRASLTELRPGSLILPNLFAPGTNSGVIGDVKQSPIVLGNGESSFSSSAADSPKRPSFREASSTMDDDARSFFILSPTKSFKVMAPSKEAMQVWVFNLEDCIAEVQAESAPINLENLQPIRVPDAQSKNCTKCNSVFSLMRRRHHCGRCGKLVCAPCSRQRVVAAVANGKDASKTKEIQIRVCDDCAKKTNESSSAATRANATGSISSEDEVKGRDDSAQPSDHYLPDGSNVSLVASQALMCICIQARSMDEIVNADEIAICEGDILAIDEINEGWATGTNLTTDAYGFMPANFMRLHTDDQKELPEHFDGTSEPIPTISVNEPFETRMVSTGGSSLNSTDSSPMLGSMPTHRRATSGNATAHDVGSNSLDLGSSAVVSGGLASFIRRASGETDSPSGGGPRGGRRHSLSNVDVVPSHRRSSSVQSLNELYQAALLSFADQRSLVMNEIVITERTYVRMLNALLTVFVRPLMGDYKTGKPQFGGSVLGIMNEAGDGAAVAVFMSRLEHIFTLNSKLLSDLESRLMSWSLSSTRDGNGPECLVGDVFLRFAPLVKMYDEYSSSYEFVTKTLADRERSDPKLAKFLEEKALLSESALKGQTLLSLLITPIQRPPRYLLLLKEILKRTPDNHIDKVQIEQACTLVSDVALHINEHIRERENTVQMRELDREYRSEQLLDKPNRGFVFRGELTKQSRKKNMTYQFLLFTDLLMYHKKPTPGTYNKPPKKIQLLQCKVESVVDVPPSIVYAFDVKSQSKSFRVFASDQAEKSKWIKYLNENIDNVSGPKKSGGNTGTISIAPVWNQDTQSCEICKAPFTFLFRRHHCRLCGNCVCDRCSKHRVLLENLDSKEVRVCDECFKIRGDKSKVKDVLEKQNGARNALLKPTVPTSAVVVEKPSASPMLSPSSSSSGGSFLRSTSSVFGKAIGTSGFKRSFTVGDVNSSKSPPAFGSPAHSPPPVVAALGANLGQSIAERARALAEKRQNRVDNHESKRAPTSGGGKYPSSDDADVLPKSVVLQSLAGNKNPLPPAGLPRSPTRRGAMIQSLRGGFSDESIRLDDSEDDRLSVIEFDEPEEHVPISKAAPVASLNPPAKRVPPLPLKRPNKEPFVPSPPSPPVMEEEVVEIAEEQLVEVVEELTEVIGEAGQVLELRESEEEEQVLKLKLEEKHVLESQEPDEEQALELQEPDEERALLLQEPDEEQALLLQEPEPIVFEEEQFIEEAFEKPVPAPPVVIVSVSVPILIPDLGVEPGNKMPLPPIVRAKPIAVVHETMTEESPKKKVPPPLPSTRPSLNRTPSFRAPALVEDTSVQRSDPVEQTSRSVEKADVEPAVKNDDTENVETPIEKDLLSSEANKLSSPQKFDLNSPRPTRSQSAYQLIDGRGSDLAGTDRPKLPRQSSDLGFVHVPQPPKQPPPAPPPMPRHSTPLAHPSDHAAQVAASDESIIAVNDDDDDSGDDML